MSRMAVFFLVGISQFLAMLLALLGIETIPANPLGWFLFLVGMGYMLGVGIVYFIWKERFWDTGLHGAVMQEERGDRSFWFISLGMIAVFFLSPLEYIYVAAVLPRGTWTVSIGLELVIFGTALFLWARRTLRKNYSGHLSVNARQTLVQCGPYRFIRHPAYAGFLLMALGVSAGYSSLTGLVSVVALLLPALVYRMNIEEKLLIEHFGKTYRQYAHVVKRLIPGVW